MPDTVSLEILHESPDHTAGKKERKWGEQEWGGRAPYSISMSRGGNTLSCPHGCWLSEGWASAPRETGPGTCQPLVTAFLSTNQNITLFKVCFRLRAPHWIHTVYSFKQRSGRLAVKRLQRHLRSMAPKARSSVHPHRHVFILGWEGASQQSLCSTQAHVCKWPEGPWEMIWELKIPSVSTRICKYRVCP